MFKQTSGSTDQGCIGSHRVSRLGTQHLNRPSDDSLKIEQLASGVVAVGTLNHSIRKECLWICRVCMNS